MSVLKRLKASRNIVNLKEVTTDYGDGYEIDALIGTETKKCTLIRDKETHEWKSLGDPHACAILSRTLGDIGVSLNEGLRSQSEE